MSANLPADYEERVYAGVLGKIIGVYLGRPFEGWPNERIEERLGEIDYYVHDKLNQRLIVTDDDISGTFTFIRAMEDYDCDPDLSPKQIGQSWLNYLIENRTILWWGGLGNSTEHTAFMRLVSGIDAPASGSIEMNGKVVAEQIGAQIFIDGWAMVSPGDPERAADFARRAASVSHDGEAIYGAQVLAAMEAAAFVESDTNKLIDIGTAQIPQDSVLYRMIGDIRDWHATPRRRLAQDLRRDQGELRLRQVRRQLPHGAEPRPDRAWPIARQRRLPACPDGRQHVWMGTPTATRATSVACSASSTVSPASTRVPTGAVPSPTSATCRAPTAAAASPMP